MVREGEELKYDQPYIVLSTDKADIEVPSEQSGFVHKVCVQVDQMVEVGEVLLILESALDRVQAKSKADRANVQTGLLYLSTKDADYLCNRSELGRRTFGEHKSFVEDTVSVARDFRLLPLDKLDNDLLDELKDTLFFVTRLIKELVGFNPLQLGPKKLTEHTRISQLLQKDQDQARQLFTDILARARDSVGIHEHPRRGWVRFGHEDRAYVFISYSHKDKRFADDLARRLDTARIQYFLDTQSIAPGEAIDDKVHEALNHASHMVVLISPGSEESEWVPYEMGYANAKKATVIPYLLHEGMRVPSFIAKYKYLNGAGDIPDLIRKLKDYRRTVTEVPRTRLEIFSEWNSALVKERLKTAKEVCHQGVSSYAFLHDASDLLVELVRRGGTIRCIQIDPYGEAIQMAKLRAVGAEGRLDYIRSQIEAARQKLAEFSQQADSPDKVQFKVVDHLLEPVITIVDPELPDGTMFVTLNGFEQRLRSRPSFVLQRESTEQWFDFYYESLRIFGLIHTAGVLTSKEALKSKRPEVCHERLGRRF